MDITITPQAQRAVSAAREAYLYTLAEVLGEAGKNLQHEGDVDALFAIGEQIALEGRYDG